LPEPVTAGEAHRGRVLVVDDDPVMLKATENKLRSHGYAVSTALDGPSAIEIARRERPDLILLDLIFPPDLPMSWDGFSIMEWLRQASWVRSTPIILCTASHDHRLMQRARDAHAAGLFQKPVDYTALLGLIEHYVKVKERPQPGLLGAAGQN
jgi:CheY-like chemotaxis protein